MTLETVNTPPPPHPFPSSCRDSVNSLREKTANLASFHQELLILKWASKKRLQLGKGTALAIKSKHTL
jgi:hypothetical protein